MKQGDGWTPAHLNRAPEVDLGGSLRAAFAGMRRQKWVIGAVASGMTALALAYVLTATPEYTARAELLLDPRISTTSPSGPDGASLLLSDALVVDSEIRVLTSRGLTTRLAGDLGLFDEGAAAPEAPSGLRAIAEDLRARLLNEDQAAEPAPLLDGAPAETARREAIRREMMRGLDVRRAGNTYIIEIAYSSPDPVFSTNLVNQLIETYFIVEAEENRADSARVSSWLDERVEVLAADVNAADSAVEAYREEQQLYLMTGDILPSQAELSAASTRQIAMRSDLIELRASLEKVRAVIETQSVSGLMDGTLGGEVASPALRDLQTRYAETLEREADLVARMGAGSATVAATRRDQEQLRSLILDEARQIEDRLQARVTTTSQQIAATDAQIAELRERASSDARSSIRLRELEREAALKRAEYETMLGELNSILQIQSFERSPARVIARAVPPDIKSSPRSTRTVLLALFGGLILGGALAFLREAMDNRARRPADLREGLGVPYLGVVPARRIETARPTFAAMRIEADRARKAASGQAPGAAVIGVTGAASSDAARLAASFAGDLAARGARVALVSPGAVPGSAREIATPEAGEPLHISAGLAPSDLADPRSADALARLLGDLRGRADYVVLNLPPLERSAALRALSGLTDGVVLAVGWGRHSLPGLAERLENLPQLRRLLLGGVFTQVKPRKYQSYNGSGGRDDLAFQA
ncbi:MAG: exopolysaccharide transport family protein [Paracoccus sp. (in: a-proteobacteria)]|nr:exopolysaccharide transport family protein [Paracoccus sp. (in: a-proteobacteria)]